MTFNYILGVESSCDETAASVIKGERKILSNVVASQIDVHACFGGVVPELASRHHVVNLVPVINEAMDKAMKLDPEFKGISGLSGVAVSYGPGLVGSLMMGLQAAKGLCFYTGLPLLGVNHLEAHLEAIYAVEIKRREDLEKEPTPVVECPHVALLVSGGHTLLIHVMKRGSYVLLGGTRDDAAGEAYDKVAKMLGLGYPGGVVIDKLAVQGDPKAIHFPRAMSGRKYLDFSFSGLKTAVRSYIKKKGAPEGNSELADFCASFQESVVDALLEKATYAMERTCCKTLVLSGGVAANSRLRAKSNTLAFERGWQVKVPATNLCTDNAAMVAVAGSRVFHEGKVSGMSLDAVCRVLPGFCR